MCERLILIALLATTQALAQVELSEVVAPVLDEASASIEAAPSDAIPKFFNFGYELSKNVGVGEVLEFDKTLEIELHYERVAP